jgi:tetratricopeptide (TPR) repeat protein
MTPRLLVVLIASLILTGLAGCFSSKEATAKLPGDNAESISPGLSQENQTAEDLGNYLQNQPPRYGEDSATCVRNWNLYSEDYRHRNFQKAIEPWRWMFFNCPLATQNIYIHGVNLVEWMYANETDPLKREALLDTLMMVYDQRIQYFGREGFVLGRKVVKLAQHRPNQVQELFDISERSIELEGNATQGDVLLVNFHASARLADAGLLDPTFVVENYDRAIDIIEYSFINNPQDSAIFQTAKNNIEVLFEPYASCENLVRIFGPRFDASPEDPELLERITSMLNRAGCHDDELFYLATRNYHRLNPSAQSAFLMARMESNLKNYTKAVEYYQQAISLFENNDERFTPYLLMANIKYQHLRRLPEARVAALRAAEIRPNDGRPYLIIGEMYAGSARQCGDNELTQNVAYWAAVDKFNQARTVDQDPAVRERANQLINTFSQYFPNREIIFFHGLSEGDTYRVECWINETTRVRPR